MAGLQRKLGRRYQRYITARQAFEEKDDDPKEIWDRIIQMPEVLSAMAIDSQTNDLLPLYGLNNITRNELNNFSREYMDMAIDFALNLDPSDEVQILCIRSHERELVLASDDGTIFVIVQSLSKEKTVATPTLSLDH